MRLGLLAMSGVRVIDPELAWLGVTLPQFVARGHVVGLAAQPVAADVGGPDARRR